MRLRFGDLSADEERQRERLRAAARSAWSCLRDGDENGARELIDRADPRVALTVRRDRDDHVVHAELTAFEASAWPLAELLLAQAPADLECALSLGRSAVSLERALAEVRASHRLDLERASVRAGFGRGHLLEITLGVPGGTGAQNEQNAAENLVRALLGDRLFETWVGVVQVTAAPRGGPLRVLDARAPRPALSLAELFATVAAAARGVLQGLPDLPRSAWSDAGSTIDAREDWTMLEVEPLVRARGEAGKTGEGKSDLVLASTCTPELLRCYLEGSPCASRRFSRTGEHFVFVSYADDQRTMQARVARRTVIETALSQSVTGIGAVTGVGFGVENTYVDLALSDLEPGLERLVSKLRALDSPMQSGIRFFDSELADEWLSIGPD